MQRKRWALILTGVLLIASLAIPVQAHHTCPESWPDGTMICKRDVPTSSGETVALSGLAGDPVTHDMWSVTDDNGGSSTWYPKMVVMDLDADGHPYVKTTFKFRKPGTTAEYYTGAELDPEDIGMAPDGTRWIVDEKKLYIMQVNDQGHVLAVLTDPAGYVGRYKSGRGFEGVAVSPYRSDGTYTVYAMMQNPLTDGSDAERTVRLVSFPVNPNDFDPGDVLITEWRYQYDAPVVDGTWTGTNGMSYIPWNNQIMIIERDNQSGTGPRVKRIYTIFDPVIDANPQNPLTKTLYKDLEDYGYAFEKLEGVTHWGAESTDGHKQMTVLNDNDGSTTAGSQQTWDFDWP